MRRRHTASATGTGTMAAAPRPPRSSGGSSRAVSGAPSGILRPRRIWPGCDDAVSVTRGAALPDVFDLLPHRFPFLLVDRITSLDPGRRAEGIKRLTGGE